MQVTKVARMLAANPSERESGMKSCTVMALLDGGMLKRHKSWLKKLRGSFSIFLRARTVKLSLLVLQFPSTEDFCMTVCSKNGPGMM
ncbi:hypothetical protein K7X08_008443 [Anisodus acutangulus]|uniref:Uncharacterized protein n=1 Tax=Anisodus acutangulus TaxID=402998 RepID=A0A9Q1RP59_9SOLA|nr:hypothetical protein K7X08_008443 [Anisodus acutangulus]